jgi:hypothetical protein
LTAVLELAKMVMTKYHHSLLAQLLLHLCPRALFRRHLSALKSCRKVLKSQVSQFLHIEGISVLSLNHLADLLFHGEENILQVMATSLFQSETFLLLDGTKAVSCRLPCQVMVSIRPEAMMIEETVSTRGA